MMFDSTVLLLVESLFALIAALLLQALLGGPRSFYRALRFDRLARLLPRLIRSFERKLNRTHRTDDARRVRGIMLTVLMLAFAALGSWMALWLAGILPGGAWFELLLLAALLPLRPAADLAREMAHALEKGRIEEARKALAGTAWRNAAVLDSHGLARAPVETLAVTFSEKLVGPVFWYLLFGLPGAAVSRMARLLDEMIGASPSFGETALMCNRWLHYAPSRLGGLLLAVASLFMPYSQFGRAFRVIGRDLQRWLSPPGEWALLAMAGVLGVSLGGPSSVMTHGGAWVGSGTPNAQPRDIRRALQVYAVACLLLMLLCAALR